MLVRARSKRTELLRPSVVHESRPVLEVQNLARRFGAFQAVENVSFAVNAGEILGLLGPNGAGKSTTMLMIAGLLSPDAGEVRLHDRPCRRGDQELKRKLGLVPQDLAIYPELDAVENLRFFGSLYGIGRRELQSRIDEILTRIGLTESARRAAGTYSGGMKRRLNFGIALLHRPEVLILDEPTVGVDPQSRSHLLDCIRDQAQSGVAVIYASHYMEEVQALCERAAIIDHGKLLVCGTIASLLSRLESEVQIFVQGHGDLSTRLAGLTHVQQTGPETFVLTINGACQDLGERLRAVLHHLMAARIPVTRIETQQSNLERLFLQLTGSGLRD